MRENTKRRTIGALIVAVTAVCGFLVIPSHSLAYNPAFTSLTTVTAMEQYGAGGMQVVITDTSTNPAMCTGSMAYVLPRSNLTAADVEAMNRTILAAMLAGRQLKFKLDGTTCSAGTTSGYRVYYGVRLE